MVSRFPSQRSTLASLTTCLTLLTLLVAVPLSGAAAASGPTGTATLTGEVPNVVASGQAQYVAPHQSTALMTLNLGLPLRNEAQLQDFIDTEANQRTSMTQAEFDATYAPTAAQVQAVKNWAAANNLQVTFTSPDGLTIFAQGTTVAVQAALGVQINDYQAPSGFSFYSTNRDPTVPASLGLQSVSGLDSYHRFYRLAQGPQDTPGSGYIPTNYQQAYDLAGHGTDGTGQTIGLTLWGAGIADSDLSTFATNTGDVKMTSGTGPDQIEWLKINGNTQTSDDAQGEVALDVEYAHAMATHSHLKYWLSDCTISNGVCGPSDTGLEMAVSDAANDSSLHVVSNSWGGSEATSLNDPFVVQTTNSFMHAVAVGTTFYFSSGDTASNSGGTNLPSYPADSPYVVAVGGTHLDTTVNSTFNQYMDESAWSTASGGSGGGGGCSTVFPRPSWQIGVSTMATCTGRAEPDIAADADPSSGAYVYYNGSGGVIGGTSLAAPLVTGMAAVTNRYLSLHSKPLMGWAAPTIYKLANSAYYRDYFHDVQCGNNGYPAVGGWDEATGWGSEDWYQYTLGFAGSSPTSGPQLPGWGCDYSGTSSWIKDVSCASVTSCVAVGASGLVLTTTNAGQTWTTQTSGVSYDLRNVACPSVSICYAVGDGEGILKSTDGGVTWTSQATPIPAGIGDFIGGIACTSTTACYADAYSADVGTGGGVILQTTTGGSSWNDVLDGITDGSGNWVNMYGMTCPSATVCYAVGSHELIITNASGTWKVSSIPSTVTADSIFTGVSCTSTSSCFVVGENSSILHTTDSGSTWTSQTSPVADSFDDVACTSAAVCTIIGGGGNILGTSNAGTTWTAPQNPALIGFGTELDGIACPDNSTCYAVGFTGVILSSNSIAPFSESAAPGWNLLSLPRQLTSISSMSPLLSSLNSSLGSGAVSALATYANGRFQVYVPGYSADANLDPSQGIFVRSTATATKTWTVNGSDYPQGTQVNLNHGWNLVAAPFSGLTGDGIKSELGSACGLQEIATYSGGSYHVYTPTGGPTGSGFQVPATSGMWIECSSSGVWIPS